MSRKRKSRKATPNVDFFEPIDINSVGTDDDPCFGKLYNLSDEACRRCGDSELCAVVFGQTLHRKRAKVEKKSRFKDIELEAPKGNGAIDSWVQQKISEGTKTHIIIKKAKKLFNVDKAAVKAIIKKHK